MSIIFSVRVNSVSFLAPKELRSRRATLEFAWNLRQNNPPQKGNSPPPSAQSCQHRHDMSAVTHSSAFLSAKARVAPGAAKVRAAAAARPAARRAFVIRAADKKKGTHFRYLSRPSAWNRPRTGQNRGARSHLSRVIANDPRRVSPRHASARSHFRPRPASRSLHLVFASLMAWLFKPNTQVPSP